MTRDGVVGADGMRVPLSLTMPSTSDGGTRTPLLATVWKTPACWIAVTA